MIGQIEAAVLIIVIDLFIFGVLDFSFREILAFGVIILLRLAVLKMLAHLFKKA
jgi:hypothetical protein